MVLSRAPSLTLDKSVNMLGTKFPSMKMLNQEISEVPLKAPNFMPLVELE